MITQNKIACYHCGESSDDDSIRIEDKVFCCVGCKSVFSILNQHELVGYYCLNEMPGTKVETSNKSKFQFLDDESISSKIISFKNESQTQVEFYLPQIHCSSCLWLLENLNRLNDGIISTQVNFQEKKVKVSFAQKSISLKDVAIVLSSIGYEPLITMQDYEEGNSKKGSRVKMMKLGLVGFCFGNIMLISFPEYLGLDYQDNQVLVNFLRYASLALSLPVIFYGAKEFFTNAWSSLTQRYLNIDVPIALAISITFIRSVYEIITMTGSGYLDSMSGIVFFMLIGRGLQNKTFTNLKFNRDYKSYFPISVSIISNGIESTCKIQDVVEHDLLKLHLNEIVPVDCLLSSKLAKIDYSFVTGESEITEVKAGEVIYAGGKVISSSIEVLAVKPFSQNSFTSLWNNQAFEKNEKSGTDFVEIISRYFSFVLLVIAFSAFAYWQVYNPLNAWNALTAVLIVACPCTLLLASSYTYGFIIDLFSHEGMFVKNNTTIQKLNDINHVVFDKTGTLSVAHERDVKLIMSNASEFEMNLILSVLNQSTHPLSKLVIAANSQFHLLEVQHIKEIEGQGIEAWYDDKHVKLGKASFVGNDNIANLSGATIYFSIDDSVQGCFLISNKLKNGIQSMISDLKNYTVSLISGDNESSKEQMKTVFPKKADLLFNQSPQNKLDYIKSLQESGNSVLMIGDGINDAGALKQSNVGISVVESSFSFSPASDAILNSKSVPMLNQFLNASKSVKKLIVGTFIYSLIYNVIGISIAVSAHMKPVIAAILMPASSISVIIIAYVGTQLIHKRYFSKNSVV